MVASARQRGVVLGEKPAVPRISDLGHLYSIFAGQAGTRFDGQSSDVRAAGARCVLSPRRSRSCSTSTSSEHGLDEIAEIFGKGVKNRSGRLWFLRTQYAERLKRVPPAWDKAFEVNASDDAAVRASCVEFILAGLYAMDRISRSQEFGQVSYEL